MLSLAGEKLPYKWINHFVSVSISEQNQSAPHFPLVRGRRARQLQLHGIEQSGCLTGSREDSTIWMKLVFLGWRSIDIFPFHTVKISCIFLTLTEVLSSLGLVFPPVSRFILQLQFFSLYIPPSVFCCSFVHLMSNLYSQLAERSHTIYWSSIESLNKIL